MGAEEVKAEVARLQAEKLEKKGLKVKKDDGADAAEFEWIKLNQELATRTDGKQVESAKEKFLRKFGENPLIPLGATMTAGCLMIGLGKFARKDSAGSQLFMRGRIAAQAFTVLGLLGGVLFQVKKQIQK